jgi:hypothetical protein
MARADETEIDDWFDEEKERLEERFHTEFMRNPERAKSRFDREYRALIIALQKKHIALYEHQLRMAKLKKPFTRMKMEVHARLDLVPPWWDARVLAVKKWWFDRKFKRILRDKHNL